MGESDKTPRRSAKKARCAIYTRKSSEEGLEQAFNSLDAQREACAAFILSQKHEGWTSNLPLFPPASSLAGARHHHGHHQWPKTAATHRPDIDASDAAAAGRLGRTAKAPRLSLRTNGRFCDSPPPITLASPDVSCSAREKSQPRNGAGEIFMTVAAEIARATASAANRVGRVRPTRGNVGGS